MSSADISKSYTSAFDTTRSGRDDFGSGLNLCQTSDLSVRHQSNTCALPVLQRPPHENLRDILIILARNLLQDRIVELSADKRAVRLHEYAVRAAVLNDRPLLAERVHLDLVHGGRVEARLADLFEVLDSADCKDF